MNKLFNKSVFFLIAFLVSTPLLAAPVLRQNVVVDHAIVTVGDMFDNAGSLAEQALFRAPAPGTAGQVSLEVLRVAIAKIGLTEFDNPGIEAVNVARSGLAIGQSILETLIGDDLSARGLLPDGVMVSAMLDTPLGELYAAQSDTPITLNSLFFTQTNNRFTARFMLAGQSAFLEVTGRLDFSILTPHLVRSLTAGTILQPSDLEMRRVSLQFARNDVAPELEQLVGRQLVRQLRGGAAVRLNDISEPVLVARNDIVTLFLKAGAMTLTVKGQALADASRGQVVPVLNLLSNTVVQGIAINPGTVEIQPVSARVASL